MLIIAGLVNRAFSLFLREHQHLRKRKRSGILAFVLVARLLRPLLTMPSDGRVSQVRSITSSASDGRGGLFVEVGGCGREEDVKGAGVMEKESLFLASS